MKRSRLRNIFLKHKTDTNKLTDATNFISILKIYCFQVNVDYSTQHCLLVLIENFKEAIDTGNRFGAVLTDLSKVFDCLDHSLLVAKLHWYGLSLLSLKLIFSYFSNRTNRNKTKECFSNRLKTE